MSYVVESASSRRARRRRRTAITLVVVVALLAAAFYYTSAYLRDPPSTASGCPTSTTTARAGSTAAKPKTSSTTAATAKAPSPSQITVNVYNSTSRSGLAGDTAKLVKARGFVVGTVANDPLGKTIAASAEVRYGANGKAAAAVVEKLVSGGQPVVDSRADGSVDLVLGNGFKGLAAATTATAAPTTPRC